MMNREELNKQNAITLIALIITIIIMLILAGITLNLTLGEHGIFKTAQNASKAYSEQEARERLETVLVELQADKIVNSEYNENEYLTGKIKEAGMKVDGNIVTVDKWKFEIDRSIPKIIGNQEESKEPEEIVKTNLIAWYDGIENAGVEHSYDATSWKDLSSNNQSGATINGATWTKNGLYFDGSNDWVNMNSILMPEEDNFTIDIVISQNAYNGHIIFAQCGTEYGNGRSGISASTKDGGMGFEMNSTNGNIHVDSQYIPKLTEKVNISVVRTGNKVEIWINGNKKVEQEIIYEKIYQTNTVLGRWGKEYYFHGVIHSIKAYDEALTKEQIEQNYKVNNKRFNIEERQGNAPIIEQGLIAWYDGINNTENGQNYETTVWKDLSGNNESGATINGATWTKDGLYFDGSNDWVDMNSILMPEQSNFTIDMVISHNAYNGGLIFAQCDSSASSNGRTGIASVDGNTGIQFDSISTKDNMRIDSQYIPKLTEKVNVSIIRNGNKFEIWINGDKRVEQENTYGKILQVNSILGTWGLYKHYYFNGIIHSVKSYNRALNSSEIEQNYNANKIRFNM